MLKLPREARYGPKLLHWWIAGGEINHTPCVLQQLCLFKCAVYWCTDAKGWMLQRGIWTSGMLTN